MNQTIYPIGIQNFEKIRKDGYLYIDKTALVYQLVTTGQYYFLSRPRRFGKSLLLSTLEAYFQQPPPTLREKPVAVHAGGLLPREKGVVRGTGHGETGKGLERIPDPPF